MILAELARYYDRLAERGDVVPPGWSIEPIGVEIVLDADGALVELRRRTDLKGKNPQPMAVPKWFGRSGSGSTPFFLWDNSGYALGVSKKAGDKIGRDHAAFVALHRSRLAEASDAGLIALRRFLEQWTPSRFDADPRFTPDLLDLNMVFSFEEEDYEVSRIHDRPAAHALIDRLRQRDDADVIHCLVTGEDGPAVTLHPKIKGVDGTAIAEVPLVSFNKSAFEHYGMAQGRNAPTSQSAAFRYGAALNRLLDRQNGNRATIADATVTWWADGSAGREDGAKLGEASFAAMLDPPAFEASEGQTDGHLAGLELNVAHKVGLAVSEIARGGDPAMIVRTLLTDGQAALPFFVLGLAPNAARLVVRHWWQGDFGDAITRLAKHYSDLAVEPPPWRNRVPSPQRLLMRTIVPANVTDGYKYLRRECGHVSAEVFRAVLTGHPYPRSLLVGAIMRLRAGDDPADGWHAAVIKACIARMANQKELPVKRDINNASEPYQLGRLFAVLEAAQKAALGSVNATVTERYYGTASANPARVFGTLLRGARVHVADANKRMRGLWLNGRLDEITSKIGDFPTTMGIEDQGRFALGYYHERAWRGPKPTTGTADEPADQGRSDLS